jgi:protocatechuate 4,5-dioxygenase beta chain
MPIGLGIASSHLGALNFTSPDQFGPYQKNLTGDVPQPPEAELETPEVLGDYLSRIPQAFSVLEKKLKDYGTELLVMLGGDQQEMFDRSNVPNLMIYSGEAAWGYNVKGVAPRPAPGTTPQYQEEDLVRLKVDVETSEWLLNKLVRDEDFDVAVSREQQHMGRAGRGMPHAFYRPSPWLMPNLDIPVVMIYENTYDPPSLSAKRCYDLGITLQRLFANDPRKIAIYGSGGLTHDPGGYRAGWVDEELDRWFIEQIEAGNGKATQAMYKFDSHTMRGGTGEMRAWITVAGAMEAVGQRAVSVDYLPVRHAVTGISWAYWK